MDLEHHKEALAHWSDEDDEDDEDDEGDVESDIEYDYYFGKSRLLSYHKSLIPGYSSEQQHLICRMVGQLYF